MKKIMLLLCAGICIVSCQKEIADYTNDGGDNNGGDNNDTSNVLIGTWTFDSLSSQQHNTADVSDNGIDNLTVSDINYTSLGNFGTLTINDSLFKLTGITYSASTTLTSKVYESGNLLDSFTYSYDYYLPPANSTSKYQLIGADSVYFPEGGFSTDTSSAPQPFGMTFKLNGNALIFTQPINFDTTLVTNGVLAHETSKGVGYLYFHKK
jgi:hypothetical protein